MNKKLIPILSIVILFIIAVVLSKPLYQKQNTTEKITLSNIDSIVIEKGYKDMRFQNVTANIWTLIGEKDAVVDESKLKRVISSINQFTFTEIISENPKKYGYFQVSNNSTLKISLLKEKEIIRKYYLGKYNPSFSTTFVRKENDPKVYQVSTYLPYSINFEKDTWLVKSTDNAKLNP